MTAPAIRTLMTGLIDYAGLFPPAALSMADAVSNYAGYRASPDSWALARFVVPSVRLDFAAEGVDWRGHALSAGALADDRARFALSFGSCSFREPLDDLSALGLP